MKNKKIEKSDLFNILTLTIIFVSIVLFTLSDTYIWGSYLDWIDQHSVIPEFFRTLFYDTHEIFPDFALNIGAGQNIYNFAYYGLFNPIIMISFLLPFVSMKSYIMISTLVLVYASVVLFYYFLKSNKYSSRVTLLSSIVFLCASPLLFQSHRHIMFINYMPFLILALIGVDKYFKSNNKWLLSISVTLIIFMSFYYSIPSILCIVIYGIYKYLQSKKRITFKIFMKDGFEFLVPILIGVIASSILILPEFSAIIAGRMDSVVKIPLNSLLLPTVHVSYITYYAYGVGLTSIGIISLISLYFEKKKYNMFLAIALSSLIIFPIISFALNGFMYIDAKILIPMLPLYVLVVAKFINSLFENKIKINYIILISVLVAIISLITKTYKFSYFFYEISLTLLIIFYCNKKKKYNLFTIYLIALLIMYSLITNSADKLVFKNDVAYTEDEIQEQLIDSITENDNGMYRITTLLNKNHTSNATFENIDMYQNYIYSSIYNKDYNKFFYDTFNNPMQSRNRILTTQNSNILFLMFMNNKYLLSSNDEIIGYSLTNNKENISSYVNNDVLPFMYVSYNTFNESEFDKISFPFNNEILLNNVVTSDGLNKEYESSIKEFIPFKINEENIKLIQNDNGYEFEATDKSRINIELPAIVKNKIIMIKFDMNKKQSCKYGDQAITINGVINKLTCKEWKYYNGNTTFTYVLSQKNIKELNLEFYEGKYSISNIEYYYLDYEDIKNINEKVTEVNIDKTKTKGDKIYGTVNALDDGYLVTSIPYQKGFTIFIDDEKVNYEKINKGFVGFKISKGEHTIILNYEAPYKRVGAVLSLLGLIGIAILIINYKKN